MACDRFVIELPMRTLLANVYNSLHWTKKMRYRDDLAVYMSNGIPWKDRPKVPWDAWSILIERESPKEPDPIAILAGAKPVFDILQQKSKRHPYGLAVVKDDNSDCLIAYQAIHVQGPRKWTRITVINEAET